MLLVITFVNGTNPKQAACVFEVVWLSWLSNASLFGLVFLLFAGDIIWPGCLYLTSHLKQNPAVFLEKQHSSGMCMEEKEEMDESHLTVVIGWPALKSVERA